MFPFGLLENGQSSKPYWQFLFIFLYMIRELKNKENCKTVSNTQHELTKILQTPSRVKVRNDANVSKEDKKDSNENIRILD